MKGAILMGHIIHQRKVEKSAHTKSFTHLLTFMKHIDLYETHYCVCESISGPVDSDGNANTYPTTKA